MNSKTKSEESVFTNTISIILGIRLAALMIIMPLMLVYAKGIKGSTPILAGIVLGIANLTQAIFQFPFGKWSDKYGRKKLMVIGLVLLFAGLVMAGMATDIYTLMIARAIQGCGGITAVAYAWIGDEIVEENRNKAMGKLGVIGGLASISGLILGPMLYKVIKVSTIFMVCAVVVLIAVFYLNLFVKKDNRIRNTEASKPISIRENLKNKNVTKVVLSVMFLNYTMTALFYTFPLMVSDTIGVGRIWMVLVPATFVGIVAMRLMVKRVTKTNLNIISMIAFVFILSCGAMILVDVTAIKIAGMLIYMAGYLFLTTMLPSTVTKLANKEIMGQVTGVFNLMQYFGGFLGGILSGVLWNIKPVCAPIGIVVVALLGGLTMMSFNTESER